MSKDKGKKSDNKAPFTIEMSYRRNLYVKSLKEKGRAKEAKRVAKHILKIEQNG
jgi:hypothetical protein